MSVQLTIHTFAGVTIRLGGQPVTGLPSRSAEALLIYLACNQRPFAREVLAELLWHERDPKQALANLRAVLSGLRRLLQPHLIITRQTIAFAADSDYWLDAAAFETQVTGVLDQIEPGRPFTADAAAQLQAALDLYEGDFLSGFYLSESRGFEEWLIGQRERLRRLAVVGFSRLGGHYLASGDYVAAEVQTARLLAAEPLNEAGQRQMMLILARQGRYGAALAQYDTCRQILAEELDVPPSIQTTSLYERIRAAGSVRPHNFPPQATQFVGRETQLSLLGRHLLDPSCRLLTLTGPGGSGKTRLAIEAARRLIEGRPGAFLQGVRLVTLAAVQSAGALTTTVADALDMPFEGVRDPQAQLLGYLRDRELLLLLDNFEHLLPDQSSIDLLNQVLQQAPRVKMLVTSRERLNLQEEWLVDVPGLAVPDASEADDAIATYDAVQLFLQNARRLQHGFAPSAEDLQSIAHVCRLLEGLPLGIELASAWVRQHSPPQIATQIVGDLDFLATSLRNVPARHRSLRAVFDHSWELLAPAEQDAARKLSLFQGKISADAAAAICGVSQVVLATLLDKSFLRATENSGRFEMHELLKQYASEKLALDLDARDRLWHDYCQFYVCFMANRAERLKGGEQRRAIREISAELENVNAVWADAVARTDRAHLEKLLDSLHWFNWQRGTLAEGRDVLTQAAVALAAEGVEDDLLLARVQGNLAGFHTWLAAYDVAADLFTRSMSVMRRLEAWAPLAWALDGLGDLTFIQGDYEQAQNQMQEALDLFRQLGDRPGIAQALNSLAGVIAEGQADYATSGDLYRESLALYQELDDRFGQAKVIINLGVTAHIEADLDRARVYYREGIALCRELGHRQALAIALNNLGQVTSALGAPAEAVAHLQESVDLRRELGDRKGLALTLKSLGDVETQRAAYRPAKAYFDEALRIGLALGSSALLATILISAADLLARAGQPDKAIELLAIVARSGPGGQEDLNKIEALLAGLETGLNATGRPERGGDKGLATAARDVLRLPVG